MKFIARIMSALVLSTGIASAQDWNVDVFAGGMLPGNLLWDLVSYQTDTGETFGIGVSRNDVFVPGLEVGFELSQTGAEYTCCNPNSISGLAGMLTAKFNFVTNGRFEAYGGLGLGAVNVTYFNDAPYSNSQMVAGGQVSLGARYAISDTMKVFAEARYLDTFQDAYVAWNPPTSNAEFSATTISVGLRNSF